MLSVLLTFTLAGPPQAPEPPQAPVPIQAPVQIADPYATLYARIAAGEKLIVYSGVPMPRGTVGAVEVRIPGEESGIYFAYPRPDGTPTIERLVETPRPKAERPAVGSTTPAGVIGVESADGLLPRSAAPARSQVHMPIGARVVIPSGTNGCST